MGELSGVAAGAGGPVVIDRHGVTHRRRCRAYFNALHILASYPTAVPLSDDCMLGSWIGLSSRLSVGVWRNRKIK